MKLLRATKATQGQRENDFCWAADNELVYPGFICGRDKNDDGTFNVDGGCGCARAVCGVDTHKGTTTFVVSEEPLTRDEAEAIFEQSLVCAGWGEESGIAALDEVLKIAEPFDTGVVLERRGQHYRVRGSLL